MIINAVFATDNQGGMGKNLRMPWPRLKQDLAWFKSLTENQLVIMGANTWFSTDMPTPLPKRINAVWSTRSRSQLNLPPQVLLLTGSPADCVQQLQDLNLNIRAYVIGGAQTLTAWINQCHTVHWTQIMKEYDCDCVFNSDWQKDFWCEGSTLHDQDQLNFQITTWNRKL
jgi:dihydrofolate reductase